MIVVGIERTLESPERYIPEFSSIELLSLASARQLYCLEPQKPTDRR